MRGYFSLASLILSVGVVSAECAKHGTQIEFVDTPKEAAALAKKQEKLVFILHISGHFEDPKLT